jgi:uncharacterized protein YkwD
MDSPHGHAIAIALSARVNAGTRRGTKVGVVNLAGAFYLAAAALMVASGCGTVASAPLVADGADAGSQQNWSHLAGSRPAESPNYDGSCLGLGEPATGRRAEFVRLVNEHRLAHGLSPVEYSLTLEAAADHYAERLFHDRDVFFDHVSPDGDGPGDRAVAAGFCHEYVGENLSWGRNTRTTAEEAFENLAASPSHNENMLNPDYRYIGVGLYATTNEKGQWYFWVQEFAVDLPE